jgi:two-component system, OmpR family, aerobic respiration control sensor histidine kinase ArcB
MVRNFKILVIEDDEMSQIVAKEVLEKLGCRVDIASTGSEGVRFFENNDYDLLFVDLGIFDMDGFSVAKKIKASSKKKTKKVPLIALTEHQAESIRKRAKKLGFCDYLIKPLSEEACLRVFELCV